MGIAPSHTITGIIDAFNDIAILDQSKHNSHHLSFDNITVLVYRIDNKGLVDPLAQDFLGWP